MAKVLNKIKQMQIKLNIINTNIDEIKDERQYLDDQNFSDKKIPTKINNHFNNNSKFYTNLKKK